MVAHPAAGVRGLITAECAVGHRRAAAVQVTHPAAQACRVAAERTVGYGRAAVFRVTHPAAGLRGLITAECGVGHRRAAEFLVAHPAAEISMIITERAVSYGRAAVV